MEGGGHGERNKECWAREGGGVEEGRERRKRDERRERNVVWKNRREGNKEMERGREREAETETQRERRDRGRDRDTETERERRES